MKKILIVDENGKSTNAFVSEELANVKSDVAQQKKDNFKEHLYMGYLIVGTIAFTFGILISLKRLNGKG